MNVRNVLAFYYQQGVKDLFATALPPDELKEMEVTRTTNAGQAANSRYQLA